MKSNFTLQPMISEKSYALANAENKYTFLINGKATKVDVRNEIEKQYKVKVVSVNMITKPGKIKRDWTTYRYYRKEDGRKAIVKLKKGDKINEFLNV